ncbi:MAG: hypothetical protein WCL14_06440 [Bacteroidota bacterium]
MKNKKLFKAIMAMVILLFATGNSFAQFYINLGVGYGYNKDYLDSLIQVGPFVFNGTNTTNTINSNTIYTSSGLYSGGATYIYNKDEIHSKFGAGININGTVGYRFNENISLEVGFNYLPKTSINTETKIINNANNINYSSDTTYYTGVDETDYYYTIESSSRIRFLPSIKISAADSKITPYVKMGLVIGIGGTMKFTESENYNYISSWKSSTLDTLTYQSYKYSYAVTSNGGTSLGFSTAIGAEYKLSDQFNLYGELRLISEQWAPTHGEVNQYQTNSIDQLAGLSTDQKQFDYTNNVSNTTSYNSSNPTSPQGFNKQYPKQYFSYGSWGVNVGVKYSLKAATKKMPEDKIIDKQN